MKQNTARIEPINQSWISRWCSLTTIWFIMLNCGFRLLSQTGTPAEYWPLDIGNQWLYTTNGRTATLDLVAEDVLLNRAAVRLRGWAPGLLDGGIVLSSQGGTLKFLADCFEDRTRLEYQPAVSLLSSIPTVVGQVSSKTTVHGIVFWNIPEVVPEGAKATFQVQVMRLTSQTIKINGNDIQFKECIRIIVKQVVSAPGESDTYAVTFACDLAKGVGPIRIGVGEEDENFNNVGPLQWLTLSSATVKGKPIGPAVVLPTIVAPPQPVTVTAGQMAVLAVTAAGTAPLSYQWQKNGVNVAGATASTLTLSGVQGADAGDYRVVVSNSAGSATSAVAKLVVNPMIVAPTIVAPPRPLTVTAGQTAVLTVTAAGTAPLSYQWQKNGVNLAGATAATYTVVRVQNSDAGAYRVVVSNEAGTVTSDSANLTVLGGSVAAGATAAAVVRGGFVAGINVTDGGNGYTAEPTVTVVGGGGTGALAKAFIENGRVVEILVIIAGSGYTSLPEVRISPPPVEGVSLSLQMVAAVAMDGTNGVDRIVEWSPGPEGPWMPWTNGVGAPTGKEWIDFEGTGRLFRIRKVGGARGAVAEAGVRGGYVSSLVVREKGSGYVTPPVVTLSGGGGSGATAAAILEGDQVGWVVVVDAGSGYGTAPTVTISPPPEALSLPHRWVPALKVKGSQGIGVRWEVGETVFGPWKAWTDGMLGPDGRTMVDLSPEAMSRFYRVGTDLVSEGPAGFVWIPPGTFVMGSPTSEPNRRFDEVQHTVTLTQGFWMSDHETTQAEYQAVMGSNPSWFKGDSNRPVEQVDWNEAVLYCQKLTERERAAGRITAQQAYRLPTEAEWEYAARAGTTEARYGELDAIAWWTGNSGDQTLPVKQKAANAWGLYDMLGNVWEWCSDVYGDYPTGAVTDPTGPGSDSFRVIRGGSWDLDAGYARSAYRGWGGRNSSLGFRPALSSVR
jgi:hypothetical protein